MQNEDLKSGYNWTDELMKIRDSVGDGIQLEILTQPNMTNYNPGAEYSENGIICSIAIGVICLIAIIITFKMIRK